MSSQREGQSLSSLGARFARSSSYRPTFLRWLHVPSAEWKKCIIRSTAGGIASQHRAKSCSSAYHSVCGRGSHLEAPTTLVQGSSSRLFRLIWRHIVTPSTIAMIGSCSQDLMTRENEIPSWSVCTVSMQNGRTDVTADLRCSLPKVLHLEPLRLCRECLQRRR